MNESPIYLIHGFTASSKANWFPWLKEKMKNKGFEVIVPDMPNTEDPHMVPWLEKLDESVKEINENTIFIGHSLGCITTLRFILKKGFKIKGAILVSGFMDENPMKVQKAGLSEFVTGGIDVDEVKRLIPHRVVLTAVDDDIVPMEATKKMADKLDARLIILDRGGHFIDRDGVTELPHVLKFLEEFIQGEK
ncbi:putative hydrolase YdeN [anaerobic digester metagenome]